MAHHLDEVLARTGDADAQVRTLLGRLAPDVLHLGRVLLQSALHLLGELARWLERAAAVDSRLVEAGLLGPGAKPAAPAADLHLRLAHFDGPEHLGVPPTRPRKADEAAPVDLQRLVGKLHRLDGRLNEPFGRQGQGDHRDRFLILEVREGSRVSVGSLFWL